MGIVGASGAVGRAMLRLLGERRAMIGELRLFASERSAGRRLRCADRDHELLPITDSSFAGLDLVFFAAGAGVARVQVPAALAAGAVVIDNSSAFRHEPGVPLVVPEVNPEALAGAPRLIANPNCSTIIALTALAPIARSFGLRSLVASTYQAVSGAGEVGLAALEAELAGDRPPEPVFPAPILGNVIPFVGGALEAGETDEERKMRDESRKILRLPELDVVCTSVRVPVRRAHTISLVATLDREAGRVEVEALLRAAPGLRYVAEAEAAAGLNPLAAEGRGEVLTGRLRLLSGRRVALVAIGDQLLKGAALNALQIAERIFSRAGPAEGSRSLNLH